MQRFPDNARVVFIGDSLVAANQTLWRIVDFYKTHFPDSGIRFFNCGISGGTAATALRFLNENILVHKPTHAVIATGINDSKSGTLSRPRSEEKLALLTAAFDEYRQNLTRLTRILLDAGVEVTLCTPRSLRRVRPPRQRSPPRRQRPDGGLRRICPAPCRPKRPFPL